MKPKIPVPSPQSPKNMSPRHLLSHLLSHPRPDHLLHHIHFHPQPRRVTKLSHFYVELTVDWLIYRCMEPPPNLRIVASPRRQRHRSAPSLQFTVLTCGIVAATHC